MARFIQVHAVHGQALVREAAAGLLQPHAEASPKFFYDALGSRLFDAITELPEYYPTRTEAAVMAAREPEIAAAVRAALGPGFTMVDLGAGSCTKAARLFEAVAPARYVAVDISADHLRDAIGGLQRQHPALEMVGLGMDFSARLVLPPGLVEGPVLVFYPGSSIGNFTPEQALRLLREARALAPHSALLIGVDRVKDAATLEAAYDDELGVTAAFNRNLLKHLNALLGTDFRVRQWRHRALWSAAEGRIEMHLEAREALTVRWPGAERRFAAGERIHTENAYKWQPPAFEALLRRAGYGAVTHWTDARGWFSVFLAV
ncbi:MAG: L-histidine N(alpha)-methyltransferase [Rubrivivax sp.]